MDIQTVLQLVKARLNRLPGDTSLDSYLIRRINGAMDLIEQRGIKLDPSNAADMMLLVDLTVYQYNNRDTAAGMPDWLRYEIRQRWLNDGR